MTQNGYISKCETILQITIKIRPMPNQCIVMTQMVIVQKKKSKKRKCNLSQCVI